MNSENNLYPTVLFCVICTLFLPLFFQSWWLTEKLRTHWRVWRTVKWLMGAGRDIRLLEDSEASSPNVTQMNLLMCSRPHVLKIYFCSFIKRDQVEALSGTHFFFPSVTSYLLWSQNVYCLPQGLYYRFLMVIIFAYPLIRYVCEMHLPLWKLLPMNPGQASEMLLLTHFLQQVGARAVCLSSKDPLCPQAAGSLKQ